MRKLGTESGLEGSTRDESLCGKSEARGTAFILVEDTMMFPTEVRETLSYRPGQCLFIKGGHARKSEL